MLHLGDSRAVLATFAEASIDACVCDPPYELTANKRGGTGEASLNLDSPAGRSRISTGGGFMGKSWDATGVSFDPAFWREVFRVLKPGAHLLACGGTRTYHRMAAAIEDAGFEVRDCLAWLYGSGFPKSLNLGDGLGTALKPAYEPIVLARKPLKGTVKANVATHGTGALNIDACRIEGLKPEMRVVVKATDPAIFQTASATTTGEMSDVGRWPANVCLDEHAAAVLDEQSGECKAGGNLNGTEPSRPAKNTYGDYNDRREWDSYGDSGGASRFFYVAKPSREEREMGCDALEVHKRDESREDGAPGGDNPRNRGAQRRGNFHPTVKPVELMRWLIRLVTPVDGVVLDPFLGSGTTGMAAKYEQRRFIGIEREPEYFAIAERRIAAVTPLFAGISAEPDAVDPQARITSDGSTRDMFEDIA